MKIAIVGSEQVTKLLAPYDDKGWTIWACSVRNKYHPLPRWDAWFELHKPDQAGARDPWSIEDYVAWLGRQPKVYVRGDYGLPGQVQYPEAEMKAAFGPFFFTSSVAHMMALAIAHEPDAIGLWGILMSTDAEYRYQRAGCQYFIQRAWDRGIEVLVPPQSRLLEPPEERW